ncbi:phage portal protein [Catellatospora coxensis]|uniref:SPP1 Gp6-like portal protein n=1 Tax=Catellatospora coxensis TaxID=310354 RepID=A0A8J3PB24_9ACTN|nr:phage portal protein [Catellatospora coxensis]GIG10204.1 hypothetical protein Cco03nite_69040 [Catellatospora coxensis]
MPLPDGGTIPWPPKECEPINAQYATWAAWYAGDIEQLSAIYGGGVGSDTTGFFASEQGGWRAAVRGVVNGLRRWFWGARSQGNRERQRLHVPIAADIASASSDLLFAEPPTVTVPEDPDAIPPAEGETAPVDPTQVALDELMDDGTQATLLEAAEVCAALGGVYLRVVWDKAARDKPWLTAVHPDAAVPEWRWGQLAAVTFWRVILAKGKVVVRHLERHEPGRILHGVYQGTDDELGTPVSLADYPETEAIAKALDPEQGNAIVLPDAKLMTAIYVPNMKPNRIWRNTPHAAHLGRSDYAGVEQMMDALDLTWSSLIRDVDLGKARLIVPREYIQSHGAGNGASVDLDQELYEPIDVMSREDGVVSITEVQFDIRVDDHTKVIDALKASIVGAAGYSGRTFGLGGDAAVTATEVGAEQRRSFITRDRKTRYWRPGLANSLYALLVIYKDVFGAKVEPVHPQVIFADGVAVDPKALAEEINLLSAAGAISTEEMVRMRRPDWDDKQVAAEVEKIEKASRVEDPATFTGNPPPGQDDDEGDEQP